MTTLPPRAVLEKMKRAEVQKICKDHGLKANLKTETLIDLLVSVNAPRPTPVAPSRTSSRSSSRTRARTGSIVVNESDHEGGNLGKELNIDSTLTREPILPVPRRRKAMATDAALGKGRPLAAGGARPRAAPKSLSRSKTTSRSRQQSQPTIIEEPEIVEDVLEGELVIQVTEVSDPEQPVNPSQTSLENNSTRSVFMSREDVDKHVTEKLRPLYEQTKQMMSQLEQMQALKAEVERLRNQMDTVESLRQRVTDLTLEIEGLRTQTGTAASLSDEVERLKDVVKGLESRPVLPSTPQFSSTPYNTRSKPSSGNSTLPSELSSGIEILGKRVREPSDVKMDSKEQDQESTQAPTRKRARVAQEDPLPKTPANQTGDIDNPGEEVPRIPTPRALARFRVYTDADARSSRGSQSNAHLPTVDVPSSPTQPRGTRGASIEVDHPFNFTFMPPPTPVLPAAAYSFPTPQPPGSPTPTSREGDTSLLHQSRAGSTNRMGIFGPLGTPIQTRQARSRPMPSNAGIYANPAALRRAPSIDGTQQRPITGTEAAATLGLRRVGTSNDGSEDVQPIRGTIYGTELERDHRFGDFGVEGVATGFWTGGRL